MTRSGMAAGCALVALAACGPDIPEGADKRAMEARPGVSDGTFAKAKFLPGLKRLRIIKQSLSDDTIIEILEGQRDLVKFGIETHTGDNSARFMPAIAGMDQLEWLELKHLFQLGATQVDAIGPLPSLVRLELDNASAQREALTFLKDNPQVIDFEIHRSGLNNAQVGEMVDALPKLRRLGLKPTGSGFDAGALAHVAELDELEVLALWSFPEKSLFWEDGVEHLAGMKKLSRIETNGGRENWPALRQLKELRPDIEIGGGKRIILEYDSSWMGHE